ncbi:MAG: polysaccharide pyruvyl transferase family protein [Chloroflexota bacterium]
MVEALNIDDLSAKVAEPILVLGAHGYRNVGDEAILAGLLRQIGTNRRVSVLSRMPAETAALHGVNAIPLRDSVRALGSHSSLIIGGGGLFGRDMGALGRLVPAYGLLASSLGLRVAIHGVGIDRDMRPVARGLLQRLGKRAVAFTVRDSASAEVLAEWRIGAEVIPDLSAGVEPAPARVGSELLRVAGIDPDRPVVGLALTAVRTHQARALEAAIAHCIDAMPEVQFCFIPMSQHPFVDAHNDLQLGRRLKLRNPHLAILEGSPRPEDAMAVFGCLTAAVCMRYHSLLFADRMGTPIVPVPYAPKCDVWIAEHGLQPVGLEGTALASAVGASIRSARGTNAA